MKKLLSIVMASAVISGAAVAQDVKVGMLQGFTGPTESLVKPMAQGGEMAIKEVSDSGLFLGGRKVVSGGGQTVRVWDVHGGAELGCLLGHRLGVWSVTFSADGHRIASGGIQAIRLWRGETNTGADEFRADHLDFFPDPGPGFEFVAYYFELVSTP